jgi:3-isopropylmalate/(R)-2-methylmalate dehydratase small subunit
MIITGAAIVLRGDDIDTDRIMPARYLKAITFEGLEAYVFEDDRAEARARGIVHPFDDPAGASAAVLIVGSNFGCGSSREHAPQAIRRRGIRAIVGASFAEIFLSNAVAIGLPCVTAAPEALDDLRARASDGATVEVDLESLRTRAGGDEFPVAMPATARHALLTGEWDATGLLLRHYHEVERLARTIPYIAGF